MKPVVHFGTFDEGGKLVSSSFRAAVQGFRSRRVPVSLTVQEYKPKRSSPQNRYYFGVVVDLICRALNEGGVEVTREGTHELLKLRFLKEDHPIGNDGEFVTMVKSTTELNKEEFDEYLEHCKRFAAEYLNVVIPEPNEQMSIAA